MAFLNTEMVLVDVDSIMDRVHRRDRVTQCPHKSASAQRGIVERCSEEGIFLSDEQHGRCASDVLERRQHDLMVDSMLAGVTRACYRPGAERTSTDHWVIIVERALPSCFWDELTACHNPFFMTKGSNIQAQVHDKRCQILPNTIGPDCHHKRYLGITEI